MSKSIQRAIAERNRSIDNDRSSLKFNKLTMTPPLDLRTTPVLRRTASLGNREYVQEFRKLEITSNSGSSNALSDDVFLAPIIKCPPRNNLRNLILEQSNQQSDNDLATPKFSTVAPGTLKKAISFTSLDTPQESRVLNEVTHSRLDHGTTFSTLEKTDVWYTPISDPIPRSYSTSIIEELKIAREITLDPDEDDAFKSAFESENVSSSNSGEIETDNKTSKSRFWSLLSTTMMKIKGGLRGHQKAHSDIVTGVRKFASFSGWDQTEDYSRVTNESMKRNRSAMSNVSPESNSECSDANESIKRKRIQGRRPINRMRNK